MSEQREAVMFPWSQRIYIPTCDWDNCDEPTVVYRYYAPTDEWLSCCWSHSQEEGSDTRPIPEEDIIANMEPPAALSMPIRVMDYRRIPRHE